MKFLTHLLLRKVKLYMLLILNIIIIIIKMLISIFLVFIKNYNL